VVPAAAVPAAASGLLVAVARADPLAPGSRIWEWAPCQGMRNEHCSR
jgi:hypothetical protein